MIETNILVIFVIKLLRQRFDSRAHQTHVNLIITTHMRQFIYIDEQSHISRAYDNESCISHEKPIRNLCVLNFAMLEDIRRHTLNKHKAMVKSLNL